MTPQEIKDRIIEIINGSDRNITSDMIHKHLINEVDPGRTQETIRGYIRELAQDNLIGSSINGYFMINTADGAIEAINYLERRIPILQRRADNIRRLWNDRNHRNQI